MILPTVHDLDILVVLYVQYINIQYTKIYYYNIYIYIKLYKYILLTWPRRENRILSLERFLKPPAGDCTVEGHNTWGSLAAPRCTSLFMHMVCHGQHKLPAALLLDVSKPRIPHHDRASCLEASEKVPRSKMISASPSHSNIQLNSDLSACCHVWLRLTVTQHVKRRMISVILQCKMLHKDLRPQPTSTYGLWTGLRQSYSLNTLNPQKPQSLKKPTGHPTSQTP